MLTHIHMLVPTLEHSHTHLLSLSHSHTPGPSACPGPLASPCPMSRPQCPHLPKGSRPSKRQAGADRRVPGVPGVPRPCSRGRLHPGLGAEKNTGAQLSALIHDTHGTESHLAVPGPPRDVAQLCCSAEPLRSVRAPRGPTGLGPARTSGVGSAARDFRQGFSPPSTGCC